MEERGSPEKSDVKGAQVDKCGHVTHSYLPGGLSTSASEYDEVEHKVEDASRASTALDIDHRAQRQFTSMLFCCKKVIFIFCFGDVFQVAIVLKMGVLRCGSILSLVQFLFSFVLF